MSEEGKELMRELIEQTKASKGATFALLKTIRKLEGERKAAVKKLGAFTNPVRDCPVCGQGLLGDFEDELHHLHWRHPDHLGASHCPCAYCRPADCTCNFCECAHDELHGIPDDEVGTTGALIPAD